jgi:pimeloyl-ACP methyl ester carboxylesterase
MSKLRRIRARGIEFEVEEAGAGARALVLVHGFTGSRDDFREHMGPLAVLGRTVALDNRGHGGTTNSGRAEDYTTEGMAEDLGAVLDALGLERVDLLGHSLGGMIALRFVLARPERVASLILMDSSALAMTKLMPARLRDSLAARVLAEGVGALGPRMRAAAASGARPPSAKRAEERMGTDLFWSRIQAKLDAMDAVAWDALSRVLAEHVSLLDRLNEIRIPTLVLVGTEDAPLRDAADELARGIPGARLRIVPDAAHSPQLENPSAWFEAVRDHLTRVRSLPEA